MRTTCHGLELLAQWEGLSLTAYNDVGGRPTIGVGHLLLPEELSSGSILLNGVRVPYGHGITHEQALSLLAQDVIPRENAVNGAVGIPLQPNHFDALVSFAFNVGVGNFLHSGVLRAVNGHRLDMVPSELRKWVKVRGMVVPGLVNRREGEIALWEARI